MPVDPRKKVISATQAELHSVEEQNLLLTLEIQVDTQPQQKVGEKERLAKDLAGDSEIFVISASTQPTTPPGSS